MAIEYTPDAVPDPKELAFLLNTFADPYQRHQLYSITEKLAFLLGDNLHAPQGKWRETAREHVRQLDAIIGTLADTSAQRALRSLLEDHLPIQFRDRIDDPIETDVYEGRLRRVLQVMCEGREAATEHLAQLDTAWIFHPLFHTVIRGTDSQRLLQQLLFAPETLRN